MMTFLPNSGGGLVLLENLKQQNYDHKSGQVFKPTLFLHSSACQLI